MGDNNLFMNLDLNQEPPADPSPPGFESFLPEHETPRRAIVDWFRLLEAVTASARKPELINNPSVAFVSLIEPMVGVVDQNHKRDRTRLAKALEMDVDDNNTDDGLFDCNVRLNMAKDPVLTCYGHLFCWGCFYQLPYVDSISKECPVCRGEVIDSQHCTSLCEWEWEEFTGIGIEFQDKNPSKSTGVQTSYV